jgi:putative acetyltransferase
MRRMILKPADFDDPRVTDLIAYHLQDMLAVSPPGTSYALDLSGLKRPDVDVFVIWDGDTPAALGALKVLSPHHGELKSMRAYAQYRGQGLGQTMLDHLIAAARAKGLTRLSLETGSGPDFEPATRLYLKNGFVKGEGFSDYVPSEHNLFYHLEL